jgi:hypothetical protein
MLTNSEEIMTRMDKIRNHLQLQHLQYHRLLRWHQRGYKPGQEEMLLWQPEIELDNVWIDYVHVYARLHHIHKNTK